MINNDFTAILCSRLCHDLISPASALSNGLELLADEEDPVGRGEVIDLLEQSASRISSRLQFYRLAFGSAGGFAEDLDVREVHKALTDFFADGKARLSCDADVATLPKTAAKVLLNLTLLAGEGLIRGGDLLVKIQDSDGNLKLCVEARGDRFVISDAVIHALGDPTDETNLEPRTAPAYLAGQLLAEQGGDLEIAPVEPAGIRFESVITPAA
ncbi:MAG: histidine phosphotransferase family protein [Sphingomonadales bacterium]|nr:histidine phosphotransferase family protein [Sphingomonadales bacterium]